MMTGGDQEVIDEMKKMKDSQQKKGVDLRKIDEGTDEKTEDKPTR